MNDPESKLKYAIIRLRSALRDIKPGPCPICGAAEMTYDDVVIFDDESTVYFKCPLGHVLKVNADPDRPVASLPAFYSPEPVERPLGTSTPEYDPVGGGTD